MIATKELMDRLDKELEFEIPKKYPEFGMWFMKGKPDPTNQGKEYYYAPEKDSLTGEDGKEVLSNYYKKVQRT